MSARTTLVWNTSLHNAFIVVSAGKSTSVLSAPCWLNDYKLLSTGRWWCVSVCGDTVGEAVVDRARREVVDEPWFLVVLIGIVVGLLAVVSCVVVAILYQRHVSRGRKASKQPVLDGQLPRCHLLADAVNLYCHTQHRKCQKKNPQHKRTNCQKYATLNSYQWK